GRIDKYQSAKMITLHAALYDPSKDPAQEPQRLKPWHRGDETFDSQCKTLFELYGGQVVIALSKSRASKQPGLSATPSRDAALRFLCDRRQRAAGTLTRALTLDGWL